jgi:hypothetical protein
MFPVLGELADLDPDVVDGTFHLRLPIHECSGDVLQHIHPDILSDLEICKLALPMILRLGEADLPLFVRLGEALL